MSLFDTKEKMIRTLNAWNSKTFGQALSEITVTDDNAESVELLKIVIDHQKLADKPMNGYCSEGLKKDEFERMGVCYVDFFNLLEGRDEFWTPLDILHELCKNNLNRRDFYEKKAKKHKMSFERVTWLMCGRALRALPSYIREYQLKNALQNAFPHGKFHQDEDLDRKLHCDVKMTLNEKSYYFWSFIHSPRAVYQFVDKFSNNRAGMILDGNHVLCPFNRAKEIEASYRGWAFYSPRYIDEVVAAICQREPLNYDDVVGHKSLLQMSFYHRPVVIEKSYSVQPVQAAS